MAEVEDIRKHNGKLLVGSPKEPILVAVYSILLRMDYFLSEFCPVGTQWVIDTSPLHQKGPYTFEP